jgi:hypothetical protein
VAVSTDFEVVVPHLADAEELASVHVQAWREAYGGLLPERFYDDAARENWQVLWSDRLGERRREAVLGRLARRPNRGVRGARSGRRPPGAPPDRDEQLYALYVLSSCYGHGVGQLSLTRLSTSGLHDCGWPRRTRGLDGSTRGTDSLQTGPSRSIQISAALSRYAWCDRRRL